jgi:hypothetical protein
MQVQRPVPVAVVQTILRVGKPIPDGNLWVTTYDGLTGPIGVDFQWTTRETGVTAARWVVTNMPPGAPGASVVQSGPVPPATIAPPNKPSQFRINFGAFIPKQPPAPPLTIKYYVVVIPIDSQNHELKASTTAIVVYRAAETSTFDDNTGTLPWAQDLLMRAYNQFKDKGTGPVTYGLTDPLTPVQFGPGIQAFRRFGTTMGKRSYFSQTTGQDHFSKTTGQDHFSASPAPTENIPGPPASIEVLGSQSDPIVYICVPHGLPNDTPITFLWFKYTIDRRTNRFVPAADSDEYPPRGPIPPPQGDMSEFYHDTNFFTGVRWSTVLTNDDRDAGFAIEKLHALHQAPPYSAADFMQRLKARALGQDISARALQAYQHVTLRGVVEVGGFPDSDVAAAHAVDYAHDGIVLTGPLLILWFDGCVWPGMDWDMKVTPDPAYMYLKSADRDDVGVEIESFALRGPDDPCGPAWDQQKALSYLPHGKHYLQTTGRWVTDNAHDSDLEIHPPELLAITRAVGDFATFTSVTATGAWRGTAPLTFVVNPPPRPSGDARLKYERIKLDGTPGFDRKDNAELDCEERGPLNNPNHLFCTVSVTGGANPVRVEDGMVGLSAERGLKTIIHTWWEARIADAGGTVTDGSRPAEGAFVFYRDGTVPGAAWSNLRVDGQGGFTLRNLTIGKPYSLVVAGSGWSFLHGRVVRTFESTGSNAPMTFVGTRVRQPFTAGSLQPHEGFVRSTAPRATSVTTQAGAQPGRPFAITLQSARQAGARPGIPGLGTSVLDQKAASEILRSILVSFTEPEGEYGVAQNGLGYRDRGTVHFQLKGLVGADGKPVPDLKSAYSIDTSGPSPTITVNGVPTATVSGARIRARLLLGNQWTGYRVAAMAETTTGYNGFARLKFQTGSAVEEMAIDVEVLENPFNPWFLPKIGGDVHLVYPAGGTSTSGRGFGSPAVALRPTAYTLEAIALTPAFASARSSSVVGGDADDFARLRRTLSKTNEISGLAAKPSLLKPVRKKVTDIDKR